MCVETSNYNTTEINVDTFVYVPTNVIKRAIISSKLLSYFKHAYLQYELDYDWINKYLKGTYVIIQVNQRQKSCSVNQMRRMISRFW